MLSTTKYNLNNLIKFLYYLTFFLFSFGQLGRISLNNQEINFYFYEISLFLLFSVMLLEYRFKPFLKIFSKFKYLTFFILWLLFTFILSVQGYNLYHNISAFLYLARLTFYLIILILLTYSFKEKDIQFSDLKNSILIILITVIISSFIQYLFMPDLINLVYLGWDQHLYRLFGVFFDTSIASAVFGFLLLEAIMNKRVIMNPFLRNTITGILLIFCLMTFSRSLYIALFLVLFIYFLSKKSYTKLLFIFIVSIFILILLPKPRGEGVNLTRVFSINSRIVDYNNALLLWNKYPIFGIGYNHIRYSKDQNVINIKQNYPSHSAASFHSSFLNILVTTGLFGMILFLLFLIEMVKNSNNSVYLVLFFSLLSMFDNIILHPFILFILMIKTGYYSSLE